MKFPRPSTNDLLILGGGAVAGYLVASQINGDDVYDFLQMIGVYPDHDVEDATHQAGSGAAGGGPGDVATGFHTGCAKTANPGGNSPGWYTQGPWGPGHHHCDWKQKCCFCTDVPKCIKSGTPPWRPGDCRPDWGTSGYLGGGPYPSSFSFSQCPPGTAP